MRSPDRAFWRAWDRAARWMAARSPQAAYGESWCIYCVRNDGRTRIFSGEEVLRHAVEDHQAGDRIRLQVGTRKMEDSP